MDDTRSKGGSAVQRIETVRFDAFGEIIGAGPPEGNKLLHTDPAGDESVQRIVSHHPLELSYVPGQRAGVADGEEIVA
ncbi:hypothetical protein KAU45_11455, partial [bacterium]|nr:hypothetical protein [bacterium]